MIYTVGSEWHYSEVFVGLYLHEIFFFTIHATFIILVEHHQREFRDRLHNLNLQ